MAARPLGRRPHARISKRLGQPRLFQDCVGCVPRFYGAVNYKTPTLDRAIPELVIAAALDLKGATSCGEDPLDLGSE